MKTSVLLVALVAVVGSTGSSIAEPKKGKAKAVQPRFITGSIVPSGITTKRTMQSVKKVYCPRTGHLLN